MYVVWRKRPVKGTGGGPFLLGNPEFRNSDCARAWHGLRCEHRGTGRVAHTALVVASERVNGEPRQSVLFRFATIRSCCAADEFARAAWWHDVTFSMETWEEWAFHDLKTQRLVTDLSRDRAAMLRKLREVVPRPHPAMAAAFKRFAEEAERDLRASFDEAYRTLAEQQERERRERGEPEPESARFWREAFAGFAALKTPAGPNALEVLGLKPGASEAEIRASHRRLVMVHHPDKGGDPERFRAIQQAYEAAMSVA